MKVRPWWLGALALLLTLGLCWLPPAGAGAAANADGAGARGAGAGPADLSGVVAAGSFELAKVRILGVPALTVASPVVGHQDNAPDARRRAAVIEGNLRLLYDPEHL
ncbi:hypothetical protein [Cyanobium sp. N5-Cardenillas]|uniref:hypothetical protein n=1 Tax=Cyanobium sp. N5-Cardenillas TaxID=2823720 RepID=UPI0020CD15D7|nr:hypothetical protein [Cyanobium sp. N5-Cardenillas]MCP9785849.1 hypothetical protein [Cyanobium sp. N5-Cardenillas]